MVGLLTGSFDPGIGGHSDTVGPERQDAVRHREHLETCLGKTIKAFINRIERFGAQFSGELYFYSPGNACVLIRRCFAHSF